MSFNWLFVKGLNNACIFAARIRSTMGRYCFHKVSVSSHGGYPITHLHPIILPLVPCPFQGYLSDWSQVPSWGDTPGWGTPLARDGVPPTGQAWGTPPPPDRTAEGVLSMQRAVCLLRSRRRTFLCLLVLKTFSLKSTFDSAYVFVSPFFFMCNLK